MVIDGETQRTYTSSLLPQHTRLQEFCTPFDMQHVPVYYLDGARLKTQKGRWKIRSTNVISDTGRTLKTLLTGQVI